MNFVTEEEPLCKGLENLSLSNSFKVEDYPQISNNSIYRVFMNPKNISSLKIEADSSIIINNKHILTVWPNISCPFNCIIFYYFLILSCYDEYTVKKNIFN